MESLQLKSFQLKERKREKETNLISYKLKASWEQINLPNSP